MSGSAIPPSSTFLQRYCRNPTAVVSSVILAAIVLVAILAPYIAPHDPARSSLRAILKPPSAMYWLGSDDLGRDVASRLIFASRLSLVASVQAVFIAVVIGLPHPRWIEAVTAVVVLKPGVEASEEEIVRHCKEHLGGFEVPKAVRFVDALPMTSTGKIQKQPLRQAYQGLYG